MEKEEKKKKLTYEELEAYAQQTTARAKQIYDENMQLQKALQAMQAQANYEAINIAFKVIEYKSNFSESFVKAIIEYLEKVLNPTNQEEKTSKEGE